MTTTAALERNRDALTDELNAMPVWKQGSPWHLDRVRALRRVVASLDSPARREPVRVLKLRVFAGA